MSGLTDNLFMFADFVSAFIWVLVIVDIIFIFILLFLEKMDPRSFVAWLVIFIFLPFLGIILYLFIGCTIYKKNSFISKDEENCDLESVHLNEDEYASIDKIEDGTTRSLARSISRCGGIGYSDNNDVELITDGNEMMDALFKDLESAKKSILFEYYIIRDDEYGNRLLEILTEKVKEGLDVYLLTDSFGNGKGPKKSIAKFIKSGGNFALFHIPLKLIFSPKKNHRNHRKIAVIDGTVCYCGGYNIGKEYVHMGRFGFWRDASLRIVGDAAIPLTIRSICDWNYSVGKKQKIINPSNLIPKKNISDIKKERVHIVSGGPDYHENNPVMMQYLEMIKFAKETLYITTPYLTPDDIMVEFIKCSAMAGVDVRIIVPAVGDHIFVHWNTLSSANQLMKYGVRVYLHQNGFNHAKTIICDNIALSVGSANMDDRSLRLNFETNAIVYSDKLCRDMKKVFIKDLSYCTEYSCEEYDNMPIKYKIRTKISYYFKMIS